MGGKGRQKNTGPHSADLTAHSEGKLHIAQSHPCSMLSLSPLLHQFSPPQLLLQHILQMDLDHNKTL